MDIQTAVIDRITFGRAQRGPHISVVPLHVDLPERPPYITMAEALELEQLVITELGSGGSIPELEVLNSASTHVIILEGEELVGAKQNRVLNTTVLLRPGSRTRIPVSCTESGRWSPVSRHFRDSGAIMPRPLRFNKIQSVTSSLRRRQTFASDQSSVWSDIKAYLADTGTYSETNAMNQAVKDRRPAADETIRNFTVEPGQNGVCVLLDGRVSGLEILSDPAAFEQVWPRIIRSYALDLPKRLLDDEDEGETLVGLATEFIQRVRDAEHTEHAAVSDGRDHRYVLPGMVGSVMTWEETVVHMSVLRRE